MTRRRSFSTQVSPDVQARARAAVRGVRAVTGDDSWTLGALTESALVAYLDSLEAKYNDGNPWPIDAGQPLRPGARIQQP